MQVPGGQNSWESGLWNIGNCILKYSIIFILIEGAYLLGKSELAIWIYHQRGHSICKKSVKCIPVIVLQLFIQHTVNVFTTSKPDLKN